MRVGHESCFGRQRGTARWEEGEAVVCGWWCGWCLARVSCLFLSCPTTRNPATPDALLSATVIRGYGRPERTSSVAMQSRYVGRCHCSSHSRVCPSSAVRCQQHILRYRSPLAAALLTRSAPARARTVDEVSGFEAEQVPHTATMISREGCLAREAGRVRAQERKDQQ